MSSQHKIVPWATDEHGWYIYLNSIGLFLIDFQSGEYCLSSKSITVFPISSSPNKSSKSYASISKGYTPGNLILNSKVSKNLGFGSSNW